MWPRDAVVVYTHISPSLNTESPVAQWLEHPYQITERRGSKSHLGLRFLKSEFPVDDNAEK